MATLPTQGGDTDTWGTELNEYLLAMPGREHVRVASTANVTINPGGTSLSIDGIALGDGNRVLLKNQTTAAQNGIYLVGGVGTSVTLTRAADANAAAHFTGAARLQVAVRQGTVHANSVFELVPLVGAFTLGTTPLYFTQVQPPLNQPGAERNLWNGISAGTTLLESMAWQSVLSNATTITSGTMRLTGGFYVPAGMTLSSVELASGNTAGATLTNSWCCLVRQSDNVILAVSPNDTTAAWATFTNRVYTFGAAWTAPFDTACYLGVVIVGTTMPTLIGQINMAAGLGTRRVGNSNTGLTTPLTVGTAVTAPGSGQSHMHYGAFK